MRLGVTLGGPSATTSIAHLGRLALEAEQLGFATAWTAEAYGCDAVSTLGWIAGQTSQIGLGAAVMQIPARTPAMTAMTAATLDLISAGRFHLGLGVSGPAVSEGWHGVRFDEPLARTREYVEIVRMALRGERLEYSGAQFALPVSGTTYRPLRMSIRPAADVPIYLAAVGPKNIGLAGEIADGWLAAFFSARASVAQVRAIKARAAEFARKFEVIATVPVSVGADPQLAADRLRDYFALYLGGMGTPQRNFYNRLAHAMGYGGPATLIQQRYLGGDRAGAAAAVPFELIDELALLGTASRMADYLLAYAAAGVDTVSLWPVGQSEQEAVQALATAAEALELAGLGR